MADKITIDTFKALQVEQQLIKLQGQFQKAQFPSKERMAFETLSKSSTENVLDLSLIHI